MRESLRSLSESKLFGILAKENSLEWSMKARRLYWFWKNANFPWRNQCRLPFIGMNIVDHCNLNCSGCVNWSPLSERRFANIDVHKRDITRLSQLFERIDEVHLVGGEPLLHPQLLDFLSVTRRILPKSMIILITNGLLLPKAQEDFWAVASRNNICVRISSYPIKQDFKSISDIANLHGVKLIVHPIKLFLKFSMNLNGDSDPSRTFAYCRKFFRCNFLRDGRIYPCGKPAMSQTSLIKRYSLDLPLSDKDSIDIHSGVTGEDILNFLENPIPWCRFCTTASTTFKWRPNNHALDEWI